jgi:LuxR family maltose regulon positive regulatory protein
LWVTYASTLLGAGQRTGVEQKLQAAETALAASAAVGVELDDKTRDLVGRIAAIRATLAISQHQVETIIVQSHRALEYLHPDNLAFRTSTTWKLGYAYHLQGDHAAASRAYTEAMSIGQASGNILFTVSAMLGLGSLQETATQLYLAAESYRRALHLLGDQPLPTLACEAHLGLARIFYEWNDLDAAQQHRQQSVQLVRQTEGNDTFAACEVFLARLKLAEEDVAGAAAVLAQADQFVRQHNLVNRLPEVAAAQVRTLLYQGNLEAAADLAETHELPISKARVHLARGDTSAALAALGPLCQQMEAKGFADERLKVMVLQAVAHYAAALQADGEKEEAMQFLGDTLALAEPGGFIRLFVDEGMPMARLLSEAAAQGIMPDYVGKLLAAFEAEEHKSAIFPPSQPLVEPLSPRELEVLGLIAQGLSNREIGERLFLALSTVKGHNRRIYGKLHVRRRTEAVARARELGLL